MNHEVIPDWDEADRLAALHGFAILDTETETIFADFVQIAAHVCQAPIAVVNLIDAHRQWFAAEIGLGVRQTPLDISICAHAILQPGVFVVPDLTQDARFGCNPLVTGDPRLRFYGGALLETPEGLPLGTMCVLDYKPRPEGLTEAQAATLRALARQVMTQLSLRRVVAEKQALVDEKELLVLEAHHRVKNSLATVQALLLTQARTAASPEAATQLRDAARRIQTFGAMHEHLYRVGAAAEVNLATYLQSLLDDQAASQAGASKAGPVVFHATPLEWPSADAPTLGLILLELLNNAFKYGAGTITATLASVQGKAVLTVEDEGATLPPDFQPGQSKGFGMRIVTGLLRGQNRGHLAIDRTRPHTCFVATLESPA